MDSIQIAYYEMIYTKSQWKVVKTQNYILTKLLTPTSPSQKKKVVLKNVYN